jgi:hypothetical protein
MMPLPSNAGPLSSKHTRASPIAQDDLAIRADVGEQRDAGMANIPVASTPPTMSLPT